MLLPCAPVPHRRLNGAEVDDASGVDEVAFLGKIAGYRKRVLEAGKDSIQRKLKARPEINSKELRDLLCRRSNRVCMDTARR